MMRVATWPLRAVNRLRRWGPDRRPTLPRPCVSVGNLALGGRGKTPLVAALAELWCSSGVRVAILSRGYGGRIRPRDEPQVLLCTGSGPAWLRPVRQEVPLVGDEPAWLAATCPGVPVGVHPRRERAAAAVLESHDVDLFLLDDGLQARVARDVDVVMLHGRDDPPFGGRSALREGASILDRVEAVCVLDPAGPLPPAWTPIHRRFAGLHALKDGRPLDAGDLGPLVVAAGVGDPDSVVRVAEQGGVRVRSTVALRDHRPASPRARRELVDETVLVTQKDAMGWAAVAPPSPRTVVLDQRLDGVDALFQQLASSPLLGPLGGRPPNM